MRPVLFCTLLYTLSATAATAQRVFPAQTTSPTGFNAPMSNSPLLFSDWVKATIVSENPLFKNDSIFLYNFDKSAQKLLATADRQIQYRINSKEFQSITFYYSADN